jgi:hypothetical protein
MSDYKNVDVALADLDYLIDQQLAGFIKQGGFDNKAIVWLIMAWTKIVILLGNTTGLGAYWIMKREPDKTNIKRSLELDHALDAYRQAVKDPNTRFGDAFRRVNNALLNLVWDYRQHISGQTEAEFVHMIHDFMGLSVDQLMQKVIFPMDQHA